MPFLPIALSLAKFIPDIIGWVSGDGAEKKAEKVVSVAQAVLGVQDKEDLPSILERSPDAVLKLQSELRAFQLKQYEQETGRLKIVNETMRSEYTSTDKYNSRWRATFGYCMAISWFLVFCAVGFAVVWSTIKPDNAQPVISNLATLLQSSSTLWTVALAVLGVTVHKRSQDKQTASGQAQPGLIDKITSLFGK